mmetsp:Transcript_32059/g.84134  ORF Transcript_32059/g.84134 Transcript_32059/m.84134 type:complete len:200 (+) Transcript_32059:133-732(+)
MSVPFWLAVQPLKPRPYFWFSAKPATSSMRASNLTFGPPHCGQVQSAGRDSNSVPGPYSPFPHIWLYSNPQFRHWCTPVVRCMNTSASGGASSRTLTSSSSRSITDTPAVSMGGASNSPKSNSPESLFFAPSAAGDRTRRPRERGEAQPHIHEGPWAASSHSAAAQGSARDLRHRARAAGAMVLGRPTQARSGGSGPEA